MQMMSGEALSIPSSIRGFSQEPNSGLNPNRNSTNPVAKKKRNLPGTPDPDAEVIALSPKTLMATNRFICEICNKGFQRDQNLQLHRRGHNLPWKLKQRTSKEIRKKVYICPEKSCVHHDPSRALGDLTGIKKHFSRKHGEKKWKCEKCSKKYAVQSDWKAHSKICGTREYKCDCGTLFSRKDSFITHRAFCDALAEESARITSVASTNLNFRTDSINGPTSGNPQQSILAHGFANRGGLDAPEIPQICPNFRPDFGSPESAGELQKPRLSLWLNQANSHLSTIDMGANSHPYPPPSSSTGMPELVEMASTSLFGSSSSIVDYEGRVHQSQWNLKSPQGSKEEEGSKGNMVDSLSSLYSHNRSHQSNPTPMSATALLQKAAQMGSTRSSTPILGNSFGVMSSSSSDTTSFHNPHAHNRNEFHHLLRSVKQQENLNEVLMNSITNNSPSMATSSGDRMFGGLNLRSLTETPTNLDLLAMPPSSKQSQSAPLKLHPNTKDGDQSLTRDFLGVGGVSSGRPFLPQEFAKFASMGSAMDLSQYSGTH